MTCGKQNLFSNKPLIRNVLMASGKVEFSTISKNLRFYEKTLSLSKHYLEKNCMGYIPHLLLEQNITDIVWSIKVKSKCVKTLNKVELYLSTTLLLQRALQVSHNW